MELKSYLILLSTIQVITDSILVYNFVGDSYAFI